MRRRSTISPDGQGSLVNMDADTAEPTINVISNWQTAPLHF
jgi:hypothetical protein